jgi:rubrerythrin
LGVLCNLETMTAHPLWQCPRCHADLRSEDADVECPHCGALLNVSELVTTDANREEEFDEDYPFDIDEDEPEI